MAQSPNSKVASKQRKVSKADSTATFQFVQPSNGLINANEVAAEILKENDLYEKET